MSAHLCAVIFFHVIFSLFGIHSCGIVLTSYWGGKRVGCTGNAIPRCRVAKRHTAQYLDTVREPALDKALTRGRRISLSDSSQLGISFRVAATKLGTDKGYWDGVT